MPLWSDNARLALLSKVNAHIFWGFRSFLDFQRDVGDEFTGPIVIADKGFTDRFLTVFSINREWGIKGAFVKNPRRSPLEIAPYRQEPQQGYVLELGQDPNDFSTKSDVRADGIEGYAEWLEQWPERVFRPHPKVRRSALSLAEQLEGARLVVGLNTSALIEASRAGVKVEAYGAHSMALGIDRCREERLRQLSSIEWSRTDPTCAAAIEAALEHGAAEQIVQPPSEPREIPQPRSAGKASRKRSERSPRAARAESNRGA
jgi:hypothetical protein